MRQALQDLSQYARLERETAAAQQLYRLYNRQAGLETWSLTQAAPARVKMFSKYNRRQLAQQYLSLLLLGRRRQPAALRGALDREIARTIKWSDEFAMEGALKWGDDFLPSAPAFKGAFGRTRKK